MRWKLPATLPTPVRDGLGKLTNKRGHTAELEPQGLKKSTYQEHNDLRSS
jgi:hypothetical protein